MGKTVVDYVEYMARRGHPRDPTRRAYEYILTHGELFEGAMSPSETPINSLLVYLRLRGKRSWCWFNAQMLSLGPRGFEYYEGVADNGIWTGAHAWNVYQGKVIDITWEDFPHEFKTVPGLKPLNQFQYLGVKIPADFVRKHNPIKTLKVQPLLFAYLEEVRYALEVGVW